MLPREARWFAARIQELGDDALFPMLNVGSQTEEFRRRDQPWIDGLLYDPARRRGRSIVHLDMLSAPGVDLVGDLTDPAFLASVVQLRFKSVFCANLMEHVPNPREIGRAIVAAVEPGGYLLVSCPHIFPWHPDPIDTMYRPGIEEFASLYPGTTLVRGELLRCGNLTTYILAKLAARPTALAGMLVRRKAQVVARTQKGLSARGWLPWLWRTFYQTCLVLQKPTG